MSALIELIRLETLAFKDWFSRQTLSKIIVALAYLFVMAGIMLGVYFWSNAFFRYVAPYEEFGQLTSIYILKGAFAVLIWIGILSSMISTVTYLLTSSRESDLLLTFPIPSSIHSLRVGIKTGLINLSLFTISVLPLVYAYTHNLSGSLAVLLIIVIFSQSLGQSLGYLLSFVLHGKHGRLIGLFIGLLLLFLTWLILKIIFPPELKLLNDIPSESFNTFFGSLPLIRDFWLGDMFISLSAGLYLNSLPLILLTLILLIASMITQTLLFIPCWQAQRDFSATYMKPSPRLGKIRSLNLVTKDLLSIIRNSKNLGYLFFLVSMIIAFFGLFGQGYLARGIPERFRYDSLAFSYAWLIFFTGTYLIRLSYPLGINEGLSRWWFFTLPVSTGKTLFSKILVSLVLSLPLMLLAVIEWQILPFSVSPGFFDILSLLAITLLATVFPLIGFLNTEFSLAYQPDRASTSLTGLLSILFVAIVGVLGAYLIVLTLRQLIDPAVAVNGYFTFGLITFLVAWAVTHRYLDRFTLEI